MESFDCPSSGFRFGPSGGFNLGSSGAVSFGPSGGFRFGSSGWVNSGSSGRVGMGSCDTWRMGSSDGSGWNLSTANISQSIFLVTSLLLLFMRTENLLASEKIFQIHLCMHVTECWIITEMEKIDLLYGRTVAEWLTEGHFCQMFKCHIFKGNMPLNR